MEHHLVDSDRDDPGEAFRLYAGAGEARVKFFKFAQPDGRVRFLTYTFPPGASEGLHVHHQGSAIGAYDEYYYVVSGSGEVVLEGDTIQVNAGDLVFAPLGIAHGIANTSPTEPLKILLTYLEGNPRRMAAAQASVE
jgi:mannose-6-phosphate isomerase-like protein (cupin superfamily)